MMRKLKSMATAAAFTMLGAAPAFAAVYPDKPVKIIVAYQAGQGTDTTARYIADYLTKTMGQTFIVENKGGAGGNIGTQAAARAEPRSEERRVGKEGRCRWARVEREKKWGRTRAREK